MTATLAQVMAYVRAKAQQMTIEQREEIIDAMNVLHQSGDYPIPPGLLDQAITAEHVATANTSRVVLAMRAAQVPVSMSPLPAAMERRLMALELGFERCAHLAAVPLQPAVCDTTARRVWCMPCAQVSIVPESEFPPCDVCQRVVKVKEFLLSIGPVTHCGYACSRCSGITVPPTKRPTSSRKRRRR